MKFKALIVFYILVVFPLQATELKIVPLKQLNSLTYIKKQKSERLNFKRFPLASSPSATWESPVIPEAFVLNIPKGRIYSKNGYVIVSQKYLIKELLWPWSDLKKGKQKINLATLPKVKFVKGKVVVLTQEGHSNYYHWITEILPKLALVKNMSYDYLYLPRLDYPFQHETLAVLGIDPQKIIQADQDTYIEADEVIAPSFVSKSCYTPKWVADYLKENLITAPLPFSQSFSKKVFISRQKASYRRVKNEDEVFALLKPLGFKRYYLEELKLSDQIQLFRQANTIIAFHGAGLTNLIFSKEGTQVIELFQEHEDDTYCYLSQTLGLKYNALKTVSFKKGGGYNDTIVPLKVIKQLVQKLSA